MFKYQLSPDVCDLC